MPLAQRTLPDVDLLILAFLVGFAVATLIFWPMLHRRRSRDRFARASSGREGKHALGANRARTPAAPYGAGAKPASSPVVVTTAPAPENAPRPGTDARPAAEALTTESEEAEVPPPRGREPVETPPPVDLFQQRYAARFDRARNRVARIREQLDQP